MLLKHCLYSIMGQITSLFRQSRPFFRNKQHDAFLSYGATTCEL